MMPTPIDWWRCFRECIAFLIFSLILFIARLRCFVIPWSVSVNFLGNATPENHLISRAPSYASDIDRRHAWLIGLLSIKCTAMVIMAPMSISISRRVESPLSPLNAFDSLAIGTPLISLRRHYFRMAEVVDIAAHSYVIKFRRYYADLRR